MTTETRPKTHRAPRRKSFAEQQSLFLFRFMAVFIGWLLRFWIRRFATQGTDLVPESGSVFLIGNHTSGLDPFLVAYPLRRRTPHGPGKVELFESPLIGYILRSLGIFPIRQGVADAGAVRAMIQLYRAGEVVIVFPEGGRSESGEMQAFNPDFARLVIRMRARILPVGIVGARDALPMGHYIPRPNTRVAVVYGEPFELDRYYDTELTPEIAAEAARVLESRVGEMVDKAARLRQRS